MEADDPLEAVREACGRVARRARRVALREDRIAPLAAGLVDGAGAPDPARAPLGDEAATVAFVLTLDTINFGSGWAGWPGYHVVAGALRRRFEAAGPLSAAALAALGPADAARLVGQDPGGALGDLWALYARALGELGRGLVERWGGRFEGPIEEARGSAARLVRSLAGLAPFRDVARHGGEPVPFYKKAQLAAADLAHALGGRGRGRFEDLARLTAFADNVLPHVLRLEGALEPDADLAARIDGGEPIAPGAAEEVELRAAAVHAVERLASASGLRPMDVDTILWRRGHLPRFRARPAHRTRSAYY
jgi:hypothetical protein